MSLAVFFILGTLLSFSVCDICPETSEDASSWVMLKPLGHCGDEEDLCPYQLTLPPLSIQLPKPFRELEEMAKELQNLKEVVNQLRRDCQECKDRHGIERGGRTDDGEKEERRPQSPRDDISIKETQSHSGEQVIRMFTSTLLQGDTSESDGTGMKRLDHSISEDQERTTDPKTNLNQSTTEKTGMSREVKIFNPSLDHVPDGTSNVTQVPLVESKKEGELIELSLPRKKDDVQLATHGKQQPNVLRNGQVKNISDILKERRRVLIVPDPNGLSSISTDANTKTRDLSMPAGNKRVVKFPGAGGPLRPKGSYINSRVVNVNNGDRLNNPALVRKTQSGDLTVETEPEDAGFSPARSGVMRVKETSQTQKPGLTPLTDQNKQDIRVSGPKTDDGQALKNASQVTIVRENNSKKINKTGITRLPTNLRKEKQGIVSHTATNTSISSVIKQAEQPNIVKEERKHKGLTESLVVISRETETSSAADTEDLPLSGRQVENEKYLNPISDTNNGQIDPTILDVADSNFNVRTGNPLSTDVINKTFLEGEKEEIGFNSLSAETEKKDIPSNTMATLSEKVLVKPTIFPTAKSKLTDSTVSMNRRVQSPLLHERRRISNPLTGKVRDELSQNNKRNVSKTREGNQDNRRYVMPNPPRNPKTHPTSVIIPRGPKLRQPNLMDKMSGNRSVEVPLKLSIPVRNINITRKNSSGIIKPKYTRTKPNFQPEPNTNRGVKTKVSTVTQFFSPTGATSTVEKEETKHIPQVIRSNVLDDPWIQNNSTDSKSKPETQNIDDVGNSNRAHEGKDKAEDNSETVSISNIENSAEDPNPLHRETTNSPTRVKEEKKFRLVTADINSEHPSDPDRMGNRKKRPTAPTLKKELSREPGTSKITTSTVSFRDTGHDDSTKSQEASVSFENMRGTPDGSPNVLDNQWLKNNSGESKPQQSQYVGTVHDLDNVQQGKDQAGDKNETSNIKSSAEVPNTLQSGASNSPIGGKEITISSLSTIETRRQSEAEKISSGKKRPTTPTSKKQLLKKPGTTDFTTLAISVTDTGPDNSTKMIRKHVEMAKNLSREASVSSENGSTPSGKSKVLDNQWLENNSSKSQPESRNAGNVQDLDKVQQGKNQVGDKRETVLTSNTERSPEDTNTLQSGASNSPIGRKESKISTFRTADTSSQFGGDKISSGKKRPTAPTLKKELSKEPETTQFTTSTVSVTDTDHKVIYKVTNTHVEMAKNVSRETPISFENIGVTRELERIKLNKDRVEENPRGILSNPNTADTAQGYSREKNTIPVVLETHTNVEEIKGLKLFSLSPEDTAEGFKSHEVTEREKEENKIQSTCLSDCNTTSTQHSQPSSTQTRPPPDSTREKGPAQDCSDYITKSRRNGVYRVTPHPKNNTFPAFCDMKSSGGGWTLIQHRFDGSTSFNRTWDEYKKGFGKLLGEFWLGNDKIHLLTKAKNMSLRIEIEDFEGVKEYAHYDHFFVANESQQYRLSIGGYSGTAGDAMQFSKRYNHDQKLFTTPDRDNDQYPSGNCGAYYSSGWWFDACMSANLNGKYYQSKYKGVRNGIFWGTWHNITLEYYPTNDRQSFKTVRMMIRPQN